MSKSKDRAPKEDKAEKKRKRQEESDDAPKKSKKSRKSDVEQDAPVAEAPVAESKEERKQRKRERKAKAAADAAEDNGAGKESEDFVPLVNDDVPMPDSTGDSTSKSEKKKSKKDKKEKKDRSEKKEKKSKKSKDAPEADSASSEEAVAGAEEVNGESKEDRKKAKKEKKKSKKADEEPAAETNGSEAAGAESTEADAQENGDEVAEGKKGRFIVFVGNLPYSATKESISEHFAKLNPTEIRLRTYKGTEKFMGTCFIEFDRFDRMETCLKKYHHSVFPDGKKKEGRKINVELSAGGGGNSENRKSRILAKNDKLHDERARDREKRAELEMKQSERKEKKEAKGKKGAKGEEAEEEEEAQPDNAGMHPARLAMMQAPARPMHRQRY